MTELSRRKFLKTGLTGAAVAGLMTAGCSTTSTFNMLKDKKGMNLIRNQSEEDLKILGIDPKGLDRLSDTFADMISQGLHPGAQLAIFVKGRPIIELAGGTVSPGGNPVTTSTLFQLRSTTKALAAMVMLMLHDRGRFSFDDLVAKHWPKFGANGKEAITIAQVMSHRAGISDGPMLPVRDMMDRRIVAAAIEEMTPIWKPGEENGYHAASYGWVLDELVYRWEGTNISGFIKSEVLGQVGAKNVFIGLPKTEYPRMAPMTVADRVRINNPGRADFSDFINTEEGAGQQFSWVSGMATALDLARVMNIFAYQGSFNSKTFFSKETFKRAQTPTNEPKTMDIRLHWPIRWGLGLILGDTPYIYGRKPHPKAVGHAGGGAGVAWADPDLKMSAAFLCNSMMPDPEWWYRLGRVGDRVYSIFT